MAIMADFARLPRQRKVGLFAIAGVILFALYYQFGYSKLAADVKEAANQHSSDVTQARQLDADIKEYGELKPTVTRLKAQIDQNEKALPTESELPAFFETLNRKVTESGVQVNKSKQMPEEPVEAFIKVPVDLEISGTFMQIKRFFASLAPTKNKGLSELSDQDQAVEERERIVSIENLSISDPVVKNREIVLTAKFTATTYRQEERADAAPRPLTRPPGKAASASTPQQTKTQVEGALKKAENRAKGGK